MIFTIFGLFLEFSISVQKKYVFEKTLVLQKSV
jgi:hypothetical protein